MALAAMEIFASEAVQVNGNGSALPTNVKLSASMASAGAAFQIPAQMSGRVLVRALAKADSFVATGSTSAEAVTNSTTAGNPRQAISISASPYYDFYANPGEWVAWSVA
jgi:hypothetical protein